MERSENGYRLIDAGDGRRLERFGERLVDRPAPTATASPADPAAWSGVDLRFERWSGWHAVGGALEPWRVTIGGLILELRPTDSGQVGLFPEQLANLAWLRDQVGLASAPSTGQSGSPPEAGHEGGAGGGTRPAVLNLFGYTGLVSLALAAAGAAVVHVDASRPAISWARHNAALSDLAGQPIRWIVDDAEAFVARELRRGRRYDGVILDPPSYGHGDRGRAWRMEDRLPALLAGCARLLSGPAAFCLLTAHAEGLTPAWLAESLATATGRRRAGVESGPLAIAAESGASLELGAFARFNGRAGR